LKKAKDGSGLIRLKRLGNYNFVKLWRQIERSVLPVRICVYQFKTYQFKQNIVKHKKYFLWHAFYDSMYAINGKISLIWNCEHDFFLTSKLVYSSSRSRLLKFWSGYFCLNVCKRKAIGIRVVLISLVPYQEKKVLPTGGNNISSVAFCTLNYSSGSRVFYHFFFFYS